MVWNCVERAGFDGGTPSVDRREQGPRRYRAARRALDAAFRRHTAQPFACMGGRSTLHWERQRPLPAHVRARSLRGPLAVRQHTYRTWVTG